MARSTPKPSGEATRLAAIALASLWAAGCSVGAPRVEIGSSQARLSPALADVCSIFVTISNGGSGDDALVDARADVPGAVTQIHAIRDGRMVESKKLVVPAGGALELRPGGPHIMVFNLPKDSGAGFQFTLRLRFERSGEKQTSVRIDG